MLQPFENINSKTNILYSIQRFLILINFLHWGFNRNNLWICAMETDFKLF